MHATMRPLRCDALRLVFAVCAVLAAHASQAQTAGFTPGSFQVGPSGAAMYTIPIQVPPGIAGLQPQLAFAYSSQSGNGPLGMGWGLSGLSAITRCPQTYAQDNALLGINYDANDRFCLDGQRLVAISGTYGADGTEYRTEGESFTKIVSNSAAGNGPAWFKVWTKAGEIMEFGNTADSRIEAALISTVRAWAVNKISDRKGNYLTVTYTEDNANGDYYPARIDYTGNATAAPASYNSVLLTYQARSDVTSAYEAGSVMKVLNRLISVKTYVSVLPTYLGNTQTGGGTLVKNYQLVYDNNGAAGRSRLTGLTECDSSGACLPGTSFSWQNATAQPGTIALSLAYSSGPPQSRGYGDPGYTFVGDFNGDGITDLMWAYGGWWVALGRQSGGFDAPTLWLDYADAPAGSRGYGDPGYNFVADFDGDGISDLLWAYGAWWIARGRPSGGFEAPTKWLDYASAPPGSQGYSVPGYMFVADFDGDGKADLLWGYGSWYLARSNGTSAATPTLWMAYSSAPAGSRGYGEPGYNFVADFNGDGKADLLWGYGSWYLAQSNGDTAATPALWMAYSSAPAGSRGYGEPGYNFVADFNGDGKADLLWGYGSWYLAQSSGNTAATPALWMAYSSAPAGSRGYGEPGYNFVADFNGDGKADLLWGYGSWYLAQSNGNTAATPALWMAYSSAPAGSQGYSDPSYMFVTDFNGDGKADLLWGFGSWYGATSTPAPVDTLTLVATGLGAITAVSCKPLTDSSVYAKDSTGSYPVLDLQSPMYVVSSSSQSNGVGGNLTTNYFYTGAKNHQLARSSLGFTKFEATDAQSGIKTATTFRQDYPFQGLPTLTVRTQASGAVLNQVINTWTDNPAVNAINYNLPTGKYHRSDLTSSVATGNDLNGAALPTVTTTTVYDAYGNPTSIIASTGDGYSKTTTNTYAAPDTANWFIGKLTRSTVTSVTP